MENETLNILTDWTYKQKQLVELIPLDTNGNIINLTRIQRMTINLFLQTINNQLLLNTYKKDEFGQLVFSISIKDLLERMGMESLNNISYVIKQISELKGIQIETENSVKFNSFILIAEINWDKTTDILEFVPSLRIVSSIANGWCNIVEDSDLIKSNNYVRLPMNCHNNLVGVKNTKVMIMYELLMSYAFIIKDRKKRYRIDINRLLSILESKNYTKNSEIINKVIKPLVDDLYKYYNLRMFYKCETSRKYSKISNISFRVYIDTKNDYILSTYSNTNGETVFDLYPPTIVPIFKFKDKEEWEICMSKGLTNCSWNDGDIEDEEDEIEEWL